MTFTYDGGSTTPNYAGLVEVGSIRLNDGTFELTGAPGLLLGSPGMSSGVFALSNDYGGFAGTALYTPREFNLEGNLRTPLVDDIWAAIDLLMQTFNLSATGLQTHTVNTKGWAATRQIAARINGPVEIVAPDSFDAQQIGRRGFSVPLIAPDPRLYATTLQTVIVASGGTSLTNSGTIGSPVTAWFDASAGALTAPLRLTAPDGSYIEYNADIASGHWVKVNMRDGTSATITAVDDTGANAQANLTKASASLVSPGTHTWTSAKAGGTGVIKALFRDAWS